MENIQLRKTFGMRESGGCNHQQNGDTIWLLIPLDKMGFPQ